MKSEATDVICQSSLGVVQDVGFYFTIVTNTQES